MSAAITSEFVSLNEVVTLVGFGVARTPAEELASLRADQHQLSALIDRFQAEASKAGDQRFARLPCFPISALIERLGENREYWPSSAGELDAVARELHEKQLAYLATYQEALQKVLLWAADGKIELLGRIDKHFSAPVAQITQSYCHGAVTVGHTRADIGPTAYLSDPHPLAGSILQSGQGLLPIFFDVRTSRQGLSTVKLNRTARASDPDDSSIEDWYRRERTALTTPPTREDDEMALRREFPGAAKKRQTVRYLREMFLKPRRGRRNSSPR